MKEEQFHRFIEEQDADGKKMLKEKVLSQVQTPKRRTQPLRRVIPIAVACFCVVCLAVILPFALSGSEDTAGVQNRYCDEGSYTMSVLDCNIKEYAASKGKDLLYLNWYDIADDIVTRVYTDINDDTDIIFLSESFVNGETGDTVNIYITDNHTIVAVLEHYVELGILDCNYKNVDIKWAYDTTVSSAFFEYGGYKYFIELLYPMEERAVLDIAENMLDRK